MRSLTQRGAGPGAPRNIHRASSASPACERDSPGVRARRCHGRRLARRQRSQVKRCESRLPGTRGAGRIGFRLGCVVAALRVFLPCGFIRTQISVVIRREREVRVYTRQIARRVTQWGEWARMLANHKRHVVRGGPAAARPLRYLSKSLESPADNYPMAITAPSVGTTRATWTCAAGETARQHLTCRQSQMQIPNGLPAGPGRTGDVAEATGGTG